VGGTRAIHGTTETVLLLAFLVLWSLWAFALLINYRGLRTWFAGACARSQWFVSKESRWRDPAWQETWARIWAVGALLLGVGGTVVAVVEILNGGAS
jgi:hypothetical protein